MKLKAKKAILVVSGDKKITLKKGEIIDAKLVGDGIKRFFEPVKETAAAKQPKKAEKATK